MSLIYLDNQASTPVDPRVMEAMASLWTESFGNPHSSEHFAGWAAMKAVERAAERIALTMGAIPNEVVFTSGATEANNLALLGAALGRREDGRRRIVISPIEHKSVLEVALHLADQANWEVAYAPVNSIGRVDLDGLERLMDSQTLLVSIGAVNGEIGTVQPIAEIGELAHKAGALMHSDATQAACSGPLSVIYDHCDLISLSAHKCYGPKGIGSLIVKAPVRERISPVMFGGGQQGGLRPGTIPAPLAVGFGESLVLAQTNLTGERDKISDLRERLASKLSETCDGFSVVGPKGLRHPGNLNARFEGVEAKSILAGLQPRVAASTGSACASGVEEPSHVLTAIGMSWQEASECIRFSVGRFNTQGQIDEAVELISKAVSRFRAVEAL